MAEHPRTHPLSLRQLIWICLGVIALVFFLVSAASVAGRITVSRSVANLEEHILPVQTKVSDLRRTYTDQEMGHREFMLTGDPAAADAYRLGIERADRLVTELRADLAGKGPVGDQFERSVAAIELWRSQAAEPQISARSKGAIAGVMRDKFALTDARLYDEGRTQLRNLGTQVDDLIGQELARIHSAQRLANIIQVGAACVLLVLVLATLVLVQRLLSRPLTILVDEVGSVAEGDYDQPIHRSGPSEIAELSSAVEKMRENLRASTARLVAAERRDEQARIAADLHDRVIQRVFGLGLGLTSAASRRNPDLLPFIDETDGIIRDLREVIFNLDETIASPDRPVRLRAAIIDMLESHTTALGFAPTLRFDGAIDETPMQPAMYAAALAVIRESLSNTARHAQATTAFVQVAVTGSELRIVVEDNGIGVSEGDRVGSGRRNIHIRARQFEGRAEVRNASPGSGTVIEWVVPLWSTN